MTVSSDASTPVVRRRLALVAYIAGGAGVALSLIPHIGRAIGAQPLGAVLDGVLQGLWIGGAALVVVAINAVIWRRALPMMEQLERIQRQRRFVGLLIGLILLSPVAVGLLLLVQIPLIV